jgi:hypothetical protein
MGLPIRNPSSQWRSLRQIKGRGAGAQLRLHEAPPVLPVKAPGRLLQLIYFSQSTWLGPNNNFWSTWRTASTTTLASYGTSLLQWLHICSSSVTPKKKYVGLSSTKPSCALRPISLILGARKAARNGPS